MSRLKIGLGLVVIAAAALQIVVALWPRQSGKSPREVMEPPQARESVVGREKKSASKLSESDGVLKNLGRLSGESDSAGSNAPRMQAKQIKMH
jgi:phage tail tape-measure protein